MNKNTENTILQAADAYADAATNSTGYGIAARYAAYAVADLMGDGMSKGDACETIATYMADALASRNGGKAARIGSNKVTQLAGAFDAAVNAGFKADDAEVIGATYRARVGKVIGGSKAVDALLASLKGAHAADAVAALNALPRQEASDKNLTVKAVQTFVDKVTDANWTAADALEVAKILATAAKALRNAATGTTATD